MSDSGPAERAETLLDHAEEALDAGDALAAVRICDEALSVVPNHAGAHFVRGDALKALGRLEDAATSYRKAALARPDHSSSWASLALCLFELLEFEDGQRALWRALREDRDSAEAWWVRSLFQEQRGDLAGAERSLSHARWLDSIGFPLPPRLTDEEVEGLVEEALSDLHPSLIGYLANVAIVLEEVPDLEVLLGYDPPASPLDLLGYFSGSSLMERTTEAAWSHLPGVIVLFRRNLERQATNRQELLEQLQITLYHEIGHFLGLDEEDLVLRGLD